LAVLDFNVVGRSVSGRKGGFRGAAVSVGLEGVLFNESGIRSVYLVDEETINIVLPVDIAAFELASTVAIDKREFI
jgi:hypothetical protein